MAVPLRCQQASLPSSDASQDLGPPRCQQASLPSSGAAQRVTHLGSGLRKWLLLLDVVVVAVVVVVAAADLR